MFPRHQNHGAAAQKGVIIKRGLSYQRKEGKVRLQVDTCLQYLCCMLARVQPCSHENDAYMRNPANVEIRGTYQQQAVDHLDH
jgi:hypothetical protein